LVKKLTGQVSDRQAAPTPQRFEQIVAVEVEVDRLLWVRAIDNQVEKRERGWTRDPAAEVRFQDRMVDRREITVNVAAQNVGVAVAIALIDLDGTMRASISASSTSSAVISMRSPRMNLWLLGNFSTVGRSHTRN
jgi:hypothetical protein